MLETSSIHAFNENKWNKLIKKIPVPVSFFISTITFYLHILIPESGMGTGLWVWENLVISQRSYFMRRKVIKMVTR